MQKDWNTTTKSFTTGNQHAEQPDVITTSFGTSTEVAEVAQEYMMRRCLTLVKKAVAYGVQFTNEKSMTFRVL
jgi:hypothetical protein